MKRSVYIVRMQNRIFTAISENSKIVELQACQDKTPENQFEIGDIYVGKVKNIVPNIQAAFVEISPGNECFFSMSGNPSPYFTNKVGKKPLCIGDEIIVQLEKESVKTKVPTVTSKLSCQGKYVVLTYGNNRIGVSKKINSSKREQLLEWITPYKNSIYGIVVRTNAQDISPKKLIAELEKLKEQMEQIFLKGKTRICFSCLYKAPPAYITGIKNIYQDGLESIVVEDSEIYGILSEYMKEEDPENLKKLIHYQDPQLPLHKLKGLEHVLGSALNERVWLKSGAYLIIQPTEALTVIDVNTGKAISKKKNVGETFFQINQEAAIEIARQLRLRNLSGIIVVDFINLEEAEHVKKLLLLLEHEFQKDPIPTCVVDITKLQLVEITRKKAKKSLGEMMQD